MQGGLLSGSLTMSWKSPTSKIIHSPITFQASATHAAVQGQVPVSFRKLFEPKSAMRYAQKRSKHLEVLRQFDRILLCWSNLKKKKKIELLYVFGGFLKLNFSGSLSYCFWILVHNGFKTKICPSTQVFWATEEPWRHSAQRHRQINATVPMRPRDTFDKWEGSVEPPCRLSGWTRSSRPHSRQLSGFLHKEAQMRRLWN